MKPLCSQYRRGARSRAHYAGGSRYSSRTDEPPRPQTSGDGKGVRFPGLAVLRVARLRLIPDRPSPARACRPSPSLCGHLCGQW
jgi:hypothetical protein